jgi:predicted Zn-dependent protease
MSETTPETPAVEAPPAGEQPATGSESLEERLKALEADRDKWQTLSRKNEGRAKENADKAKRFDELQEASKSEVEKAADRARQAEERASGLVQRAVRAEVRALAAEKFADPSDAAAFLNLGEFVDEGGDIDSKGIEKALDDLLKAKPHLGKPSGPPSFDAGGRTTAGAPKDMNSLIRQAAGL